MGKFKHIALLIFALTTLVLALALFVRAPVFSSIGRASEAAGHGVKAVGEGAGEIEKSVAGLISIPDKILTALAMELQQKVYSNSSSFSTERRSILELGLMQREVGIEVDYSHTYHWSTKRIVAKKRFLVTTGFDLNDSFSLEVDETAKRAMVFMPSPKVLSVQSLGVTDYPVVHPGFINKPSQGDYQQIEILLEKKVRRDSQTDLLRKDTEVFLKGRIVDVVAAFGYDVHVDFGATKVGQYSARLR